jgi:hypothetical protein
VITYLPRFLAVYAAASLGAALVGSLVGSVGFLGLLIPGALAILTGSRFAVDRGQAPSGAERAAFASVATLSCVLIRLTLGILTGLVVARLKDASFELSPPGSSALLFMGGAVVAIGLITWPSIYFGLAWGASRRT